MDKEIEKIRKRRRTEQRTARISEVVSATGWTEEKALEEMEYARKNLKISFGEYSRCHKLPITALISGEELLVRADIPVTLLLSSVTIS